MAKVTALCMDTITKKSNHVMTPCAVSVCITPAAPSPLPIPYPVVANIAEGITDPPMRTKFDGALICTVGSCFKACHGNEPGTLKEVVSLNTAGPCFLILGAINVFVELGMAGITGSPGFMNKAITVGASGSASGAGGAGGGGGSGSGASASSGGPQGPSNQSGGGGSGGGSNSGASAERASPGNSSNPADKHTCKNGHPVDVVSGAVVDEQTDISLPGLIPLVWKRYYHSARRNDRTAALGPGWAHGFEQRIERNGNVLQLRDEEGRTLTFEHIAAGASTFHRRERMWLHGTERGYRIERLEERRVYHFERFDAGEPDATAWLTRIEDARGHAIRLVYDHHRLDHIVDTAGRRVELTWERHGGHPRITGLRVIARGRSAMRVSYRYSQAGCLVAADDACRHAEQYDYDERRRMIAATIKTGVRFQYEYDDATNRCVRTWGPKGLYRVPLQYDTDKRHTYIGGEEPRIYHWNDLGQMTRQATPSGIVLDERAFDQDGYLIAEVDGEGDGTRYWYDELGHIIRVVNAADQETTFEYTYGRRTARITPDGLKTTYQYDRAGDLIGIQIPSGAAFAITRDEHGRVTAVDGPFGRMAAYEYDAEHNIAAEFDSHGNKTTYQYDELGRPISRIDALDRRTRVQYDALGRRTALFNPDGTSVRFQLDGMGNVVERIDQLGQTWTYRYGGMGVMTRIIEPDGQQWKLDWTTTERLAAVTNPRGERYSFEYDEGGRVVVETAFDGRAQRYQYNRAGLLGRVDYADDSWRSFRYSVLHRLSEESASDGSRIELKHDGVGRLLSAQLNPGQERGAEPIEVTYERDPFGQLTREQQPGGVLQYTWDALGRRTARTLPDGTVTYYEYDNDDQLSTLSHVLSGQFAQRIDFDRDAAGRAERLRASALHRTRNEMTARFSLASRYDTMDRMLEQRVESVSPSQELRSAAVVRRYDYDNAGRVTRIDDQRWGATQIRYDCAHRLLSFAGHGHREAFEYGSAGYIESALQQLGGEPVKERWELGPGNQLLSTPKAHYEYDARGRRICKRESEQVTRYHWDVRDRLQRVELPDGGAVTFRYDAFGRRVGKTSVDAQGESQQATKFLWDGDDLCGDMCEGEAWRSFVSHPYTAMPMLQAERGEVFTCVVDQVGVVKELIDDAGLVAWAGHHSAWGKLLQEQADPSSSGRRSWVPSSPFRLLGQYYDGETGLGCSRFRYFDADTARWCSPDPIGLEGGENPNSFDISPTHMWDLLGLSGNHDQRTRKEKEKSLESLKKRRDEHEAKLEAYKKDPDAYDNKGFLENAPSPEVRQRIIDGRVKHLEGEISNFNKQISALETDLGS